MGAGCELFLHSNFLFNLIYFFVSGGQETDGSKGNACCASIHILYVWSLKLQAINFWPLLPSS